MPRPKTAKQPKPSRYVEGRHKKQHDMRAASLRRMAKDYRQAAKDLAGLPGQGQAALAMARSANIHDSEADRLGKMR